MSDWLIGVRSQNIKLQISKLLFERMTSSSKPKDVEVAVPFEGFRCQKRFRF